MRKIGILIWIWSIHCILLAQTTPSHTYILKEIQVEGAQISDPHTLVALSGLVVGEKISVPGLETSTALKRLWKQQLFTDIQLHQQLIGEDSVILILRLVERSRISQITFSGLPGNQQKKLRELLELHPGTRFAPNLEYDIRRKVRNYFVEKGFFEAVVNLDLRPDPVLAHQLILEIQVEKGEKYKIGKLVVKGNEQISDKEAKRALKPLTEKKWWRFWGNSKYTYPTVDQVKKNIVYTYHNEGFRDAQLLRDTVYKTGDKQLQVEFEVEEGRPYYFRDIVWNGNVKYPTEILEEILDLKSGDVYQPQKLQERIYGGPEGGDISSLYLDQGHLFFQIDPIETRIEGDSVDLEIRISEGAPAIIRNVTVEGNDRTSDYVILREIRTQPGDVFSRSAVIRSQRELLTLGYFDQEKLDVRPIPNQATGMVDLVYAVEERSSDQFQLQLGWGGQSVDANGNTVRGGLVGTLQLVFNNFSLKRITDPKAWRPVPIGDGQKLSLAFQSNANSFTSYSLNFLEPWLGGKKPQSLGFNVAYQIFEQSTTDESGVSNLFRNRVLSAGVDFNRRLTFPDDYFRSNTGLSYKYYDMQNPGDYFQGFENENRSYINILSLNQTFSRSSVDALIYPRSGSTVSLSIEATPPYSLFGPNRDFSALSANEKYHFLEYHKWKFDGSWFWNPGGNWVINVKAQAGFLGSYNAKLGVPPFERFVLGGAGMGVGSALSGVEVVPLRGYSEQSLNNNSEYYPLYNRFVVELRYPLTLNAAAPVWMLGFLEGGNGYTGLKEFNPFQLKRSAGVGLRVMLPMVGLIGLDWGYGFDTDESTGQPSGSQFHFIIGRDL